MNAFSLLQGWPVTRVIVLFILIVTMITGCNGQVAGVGTGGTGSNQYAMAGAVQGKALSLMKAVTTIAGNATTVAGTLSSADGIGTSARFFAPAGIVTDGVNLYVVDTFNDTIRKIDISTGTVTTLAGTVGSIGWADGIGTEAKFCRPQGITTDGTNLYVADTYNNAIRKIVIATGMVSTIAGSAFNSGAADGTGTAASFNKPWGITTDGTNLYVTDSENYTIRKIVIATGEVTTLAGTAGDRGSADGTGAVARFQSPLGITADGSNLYVADYNNDTIRKVVISTGSVFTFAGTAGSYGSADGVGAAARFLGPIDITTDGSSLYVSDSNNNLIRKIVIATGVVTTLAGDGNRSGGTADGVGTAASFRFPKGITTYGTNLYVTDSDNNLIRKIVINTGAVTTLAGATNMADGDGTAARFYYPRDVTTDGTNLYVTDSMNGAIRKIVIATGTVSTLVSSGLTYPTGITTDGTNLYVTDQYDQTIRKIVIATGAVTTLAGSPYVEGHDDGTGAAASFHAPGGITTDGVNLYVAEWANYTIRKIVIATGAVTTLAGSAGNSDSVDGIGTAARFFSPNGVTTDGQNLYVTDQNGAIRKIVIATGEVSTLAGTAGYIGDFDGIGAAASFNTPQGITTDGFNLYVTDTGYGGSGNSTIRKIAIATREVTTLAGTAGKYGSADGTGAAARFNYPLGITTDGMSLYVADTGNSTIRKIQ